jgi:hypothetical protein
VRLLLHLSNWLKTKLPVTEETILSDAVKLVVKALNFVQVHDNFGEWIFLEV